MNEPNRPNEEAKRRGIKIGCTVQCVRDYPDLRFVVTGFDADGDPFGDGAGEGYYADTFEVVAPANQKPLGAPNDEAKKRGITIGCTVEAGGLSVFEVTGFDGDGDPKGADPYKRAWARDCVVKIPAPSTDQKPRGEKAPLSLLPWDVLAACRLAPPFLQKLHDDIGLLPIDRPRLASIPKERTTDFLSELIEPEAPALGVDLGDVARVFAYGETKYAPDNWRTFQWDAASDREYWSAFLRHLLADSRGEKNDPESGLPHLAHAVCCLLIVAYHEAKQ